MKFKRKAAISMIISISFALYAAVPAFAAETAKTRVCSTSEEIAGYILKMAGNREKNISVAIPRSLPEAGMRGLSLLTHVLAQDRGSTRWSYRNVAVKTSRNSKYTTFSYTLTYRATKQQDDAARRIAANMVDRWKIDGMTGREKMDKLKAYIRANWRYDTTYKNNSAYPTLKSGKGTCLGFVMACQMLLDEMGIPSQTIHGRANKTGELHIRLLVKLGKWWYTFDPTDLAVDTPDLSAYLKSNHIKPFVPDSEYLAKSFRLSFPMNPGDLGFAAA